MHTEKDTEGCYYITSDGEIIEQAPPYGERMTLAEAERLAEETRSFNEWLQERERPKWSDDPWLR